MLINFALLLAVLLGCCGLVLDIGLFELQKFQLQNAADAAALGAMFGLESSSDVPTWQAAGLADATLNGFKNGANNVSVSFSNPPATGLFVGNISTVQATVSQQVSPIFFSRLLTLSAQATAYVQPPIPCIFLLSQYSAQPSLNTDNETITGSCPVYLGRSYQFGGGSSSSGSQYYVSGSSTNSSGSVSPAPNFGTPLMYDPLSYIPAPTFSGCQYTNLSVTAPATLQPGTYCGTTSVSGSGTVTLSSGSYIIAGTLNLGNSSGGPTIAGSGVTIYMTQGGGYNYGLCTIQNVKVTLSAPTSGALQGILFFSDRNMPPLPTGQAVLTMMYWNPSSSVDGILYIRGQELNATNVVLQGKQYFGVVADDVGSPSYTLHNSSFSPKADYSSLAGGNPFHILGGQGLVE